MSYASNNPFEAVRYLWTPSKPPVIPQAIPQAIPQDLLNYRTSHNKARSFEDDEKFLTPPPIPAKDRAASAPSSRTLMPPPPIPLPRKPDFATPPRGPKAMHLECTPPRHSFTLIDTHGNVVPVSRQLTPPHASPYTQAQQPYGTWMMRPPIPQYNGQDFRYTMPAQSHFDPTSINQQHTMHAIAPVAQHNLAWTTNFHHPATVQYYNHMWGQCGFQGYYPWGDTGAWGVAEPYKHQAPIVEESGETEAEEVANVPTRLRWDKNSVPFIPGAKELADEVAAEQDMEKFVTDLTSSPPPPDEVVAVDFPGLAPQEQDSGMKVVIRRKRKRSHRSREVADDFRLMSEEFPPIKADLQVGDVAILKHQVEEKDVKTMGEKRWGSI